MTVHRTEPECRTILSATGRFIASWLAFAALVAACGQQPPPRTAPPAQAHLARVLADADTLRVRRIRPGVVYAFAWYAHGPWAVHMLEVRRSRCDVAVRAHKAGPPFTARARTSRLGAHAMAAVNADFFAIPEGTTTGAHVSGGEIRIGPGDRPVFAIAGDGVWIGRAALEGALRHGADSVPILQVNHPAESTGAARGLPRPARVRLFTGWFGEASPVDSAATAVQARRIRQGEAGILAVITMRDTVDGTLPLDSALIVFQARGRAGDWLREFARGDTVAWHTRLVRARDGRRPAREVVGGYPVLLRDGRVAAAVAESSRGFGKSRHPRTAIGVADDGRTLFLVTVDGRQEPYSAGMTLPELAGFLQTIGAERALNLDGGGSTTMVVEDRIVNRPSDETGERPVGNAVTLVEMACPNR